MKTQKNEFKTSRMLKWFLGTATVGAVVLGTCGLSRKDIKESPYSNSNLETKIVQGYKETKTKSNESNQDINYQRLYETIARHEGVRNTAYLDTKGILTIGAGFNLEKQGAKERIKSLGLDYNNVCSKKQELSNEQIYKLMKEDVDTAIKDAKNYVGKKWDELNPEAKEIIIDMSYNLGYPKLSGFKKLRQALINKDYKTAADEMKDSKWYYQTGNRSRELVDRMNSIDK